MSSWGKYDNAANAPYWAVNASIVKNNPNQAAPTAANVALLYGNTTPDVYISGQTIGLFMVDSTEMSAGGDNVTDVSIIQGGSGYVEAPGVTFSNGGGSSAAASASISGGAVNNIQITNTGSGYTSDPTVTIQVPVMTITTGQVVTGNDTIMYTSHSQANAAAVVFNWNGSANIGGLLNGTTYYVAPIDANRFKLSTTAANAANNITIDLTTTGGSGQYFTIVDGTRATAVSGRGLGVSGDGSEHATHVGWNLKRVGAGGRAGRVTYETLVALSSPSGDGSDDLTLPDA